MFKKETKKRATEWVSVRWSVWDLLPELVGWVGLLVPAQQKARVGLALVALAGQVQLAEWL